MVAISHQQRPITAAQVRTLLTPYGWVLHCSPRFNPDAGEYGSYFVFDPRRCRYVFGAPFGTSLDLIATWLSTLPNVRTQPARPRLSNAAPRN